MHDIYVNVLYVPSLEVLKSYFQIFQLFLTGTKFFSLFFVLAVLQSQLLSGGLRLELERSDFSLGFIQHLRYLCLLGKGLTQFGLTITKPAGKILHLRRLLSQLVLEAPLHLGALVGLRMNLRKVAFDVI